MRGVWRRLVCRARGHDWYRVQFVWGGWMVCDRCGKRFD